MLSVLAILPLLRRLKVSIVSIPSVLCQQMLITSGRHGDIEDTLLTLVMSRAAGGKKFDKMSVARVYFGNWLRDYCKWWSAEVIVNAKLTPPSTSNRCRYSEIRFCR